MNTLKDSSEIREAIEILDEFINESAIIAPVQPIVMPEVNSRQDLSLDDESHLSVEMGLEIPFSKEKYREDQLYNTLVSMCNRGGFKGSVVVDKNGLPLTAYNSPAGDGTIAAITAVLGDSLEKSATILQQNNANNISIDINFTHKAVLRRFFINDTPFFIIVICQQEVDERDEVELSIDKIKSVLKQTQEKQFYLELDDEA